MTKAAKAVTWLNPFREKRLPNFLKLALVINPLLCLLLLGAEGAVHDFWAHWGRSIVIADTVTAASFLWMTGVLRAESRYFARKGTMTPRHSRIWYFLAAAWAMPPGLYVGFQSALLYSRAFGLQWSPPGFEDYGSGLVFGTLTMTVFFLILTRSDAREAQRTSELRVKELDNQRLQAQLSALTAQMNPHLLFNALNTIASLIPNDPRGAEEITVKLSELYRGVLSSSRKMTHSLDEELELCRSYLAIEQFRFGPRLSVRIEIPAGLDTTSIEIPALLLQPLVENAVKHGIAPRSSGGSVWITILRDESSIRISVGDDGIGYGNSPLRNGAGTGISNCSSRMDLRYGAQGHFEISQLPSGGTLVNLLLPLTLTVKELTP